MNAPQVQRIGSKAAPSTLADWRDCAANLQSKQSANEAERARLAAHRHDLALAAATGDAGAQKRVAQIAAREQALDLEAASIAQGLAQADEGIVTGEAALAADARQHAIAQHNERLAKRLELVAEIERSMQSLAPLLAGLAALTRQIEDGHAGLGGPRPILPPLSQEAVGGRLAEFMAGIGFGGWLPIARPEVRPAIASWTSAEEAAQDRYRLPA